MKDSVIVSTGHGRLHLYHAALAAQKAGLLHSMITSMYLKNRWRPLVKIIANTTGKNVFKRMLLRHDDSLEEKRVVSLPSTEFVSRLKAFITCRGAKEELRFRLERIESLYYGKRTNRYIKQGVRLIHSRSGYSRAIIPYAKKINAKILLEQSAAHPKFANKILEAEYEHWEIPKKFRTYVGPVREMEWDISQAEYILTNSDYVAQSVRENTQSYKKLFVVHTGINATVFKPRKKDLQGPFRVLYVGNISTYKGIGYLIKAFANLKLPQAELVLVGNKNIDCPSAIEEFRQYFRYIPAVPYIDIPAIFADADLFVFPSVVEGPSRVVGEAMATGLPCIVTPTIPNCGHIIKDGNDGFVVAPQNEDAIAEKILYLYENRDICHEMGQRARKSAISSLTWEHYQQNLIKVYEEILSDRNNI